ncbi:hypothetical protein KC669_03030 [Candidatus Dojkabacteria bacterium]|uniref:Uncharacterized protein n=1 Tax=Candidatus Dojkabacteria bacterium TaxID=2099670 RepID=A0A955LB96_9BACT|nr:hypothetical protein [Candidatus Dojkabacteria bacterium]
MQSINKNKKASVALTTVIALIAILSFGAISLLLVTVDASRVNKDLEDYSISYLKSLTCLEEGILKIRNDNNYTGAFTISLDTEDQCTGDISNLGGNNRQIIVTANNEETNFYREYIIDISTTPFTVSF